MIANVEVPIYKTTRKKKTLLGWNQIALMHYKSRNNLKVWYTKEVEKRIDRTNMETYDGLYEAVFTLYYENVRCDLSNVCSVADKFVMDAIQELGLVKNDNVSRYVKATYLVGGRDKENPRVEVIIKRI